MNVGLSALSSYIEKYIAEYRQQYNKYCSEPPIGGGFPKLDVSPYIYAEQLECFLLNDGVAIFALSPVAGAGHHQEADNFSFPNNSPGFKITNVVIDTSFRTTLTVQTRVKETEITLVLSKVDEDIHTFLNKFMLGFLMCIDIKLEIQGDLFYCPHIIRNIGISNVLMNKRKYMPYLEIHTHNDMSAWDERSIYIRVSADIRRDFTHAATLALQEKNTGGGSISFGRNVTDQFLSSLSILHAKVNNLQKLLNENPDAIEDVFQKELEQSPEIVDIYGKVTPHPQGFKYSFGVTGPDGKQSYIPDFIVEYPNFQWRLIEIEKPNKKVRTKEGHPRSEFTQAMHQIKQWKHLIRQYPEAVRSLYPGITEHCKYTLILGRDTASFQGKDLASYKSMIIGGETDIDVYTYDEFIVRIKEALTVLETIRI